MLFSDIEVAGALSELPDDYVLRIEGLPGLVTTQLRSRPVSEWSLAVRGAIMAAALQRRSPSVPSTPPVSSTARAVLAPALSDDRRGRSGSGVPSPTAILGMLPMPPIGDREVLAQIERIVSKRCPDAPVAFPDHAAVRGVLDLVCRIRDLEEVVETRRHPASRQEDPREAGAARRFGEVLEALGGRQGAPDWGPAARAVFKLVEYVQAPEGGSLTERGADVLAFAVEAANRAETGESLPDNWRLVIGWGG